MIFAKIFLSIIVIITTIASYLYILKITLGFKFSLTITVIILAGLLLLLSLFIVVSLYIRRIRKYDVSRLDNRDIRSISRFLSFIPLFFVLASIIIVLAVSVYEYRETKSLSKLLNIISFSIPISFISYYLLKIPIYELKFNGFYSFNRKSISSIFSYFILLMFINVILGVGLIFISLTYAKQSLQVIIYVSVFSFITSLILFMANLVVKLRYIIKILKVPELFDKFIPTLSNDEIGLISFYLESIVNECKQTSSFPQIYLGDNKINIELGKQFCGCLWMKLFDTSKIFSEFSEKIIDDIQSIFSKIEAKAIENRGHIARFEGTEMYIVWGLDGGEWFDNLRSFVNFLSSTYKYNELDRINIFKVGISSGRIFVGKTDSIYGSLPYFFGEAMIESYIVGKYPEGDGIFISGDIKDIFENTEFVKEIKVKETGKIVEIYRLFI
ncbi:MAG: hypothetical protein N2712_00520 [Brevinematales bacterium]|nr:hypothetical protein [Brevinematales bacterium]